MRAGVEWTGKLPPGGGQGGRDGKAGGRAATEDGGWAAISLTPDTDETACISASSQPEGLYAGDLLQITIFLCTEADKLMQYGRIACKGDTGGDLTFAGRKASAWLAFMLTLQGQTGCMERISYTAQQKLTWWLLSCARIIFHIFIYICNELMQNLKALK